MSCFSTCTKTVRAVAHVRGGAATIVICLTCGAAHTRNHGLSEDDLEALVAFARTLKEYKAPSRLTVRKTSHFGGKNGKAK